MITRMGTCLPKLGVDANQFWNYHTKIVARDVTRYMGPGVRRYVMSRVTKVISGDPRFSDLTEFWYEDEGAMAQEVEETWVLITAPAGKNLYDDFVMWVIDNCSSIIEQVMVKGTTPKIDTDMQMNKLVKRGTTCSLRGGVNGDEFWDYLTQVHAPNIVKAGSPGLKKYSISRITKVVNGLANKRFDAIEEMWWDSEESMNKDYEVWSTTILPNGKSVFDSFNSWVASTSSFMMEEFIAKESTGLS